MTAQPPQSLRYKQGQPKTYLISAKNALALPVNHFVLKKNLIVECMKSTVPALQSPTISGKG
jgi:hypothetical protein